MYIFKKREHGIFITGGRGVSRIFERGGSNISWFPKKRSSDFKRGVQWSERRGGSSTFSLPRTTNLAYLDANGIFKLKLPSQAHR